MICRPRTTAQSSFRSPALLDPRVIGEQGGERAVFDGMPDRAPESFLQSDEAAPEPIKVSRLGEIHTGTMHQSGAVLVDLAAARRVQTDAEFRREFRDTANELGFQ